MARLQAFSASFNAIRHATRCYVGCCPAAKHDLTKWSRERLGRDGAISLQLDGRLHEHSAKSLELFVRQFINLPKELSWRNLESKKMTEKLSSLKCERSTRIQSYYTPSASRMVLCVCDYSTTTERQHEVATHNVDVKPVLRPPQWIVAVSAGSRSTG